jgi:antitoxin HigA-1
MVCLFSKIALANHLNIPRQNIHEIIAGQRGITPETAWLLSQALNTTPQFWMNLQTNYDLAVNKPQKITEAIAV